jgi:hypothetical protein
MRGKAIALFTAGMFVLASMAGAQTNPVPSDAADATGNRIDLYFSDWHASTPHMVNGSLEEREIFTHGDGVNPARKGAVLRFVNSYNYATLAPHCSVRNADWGQASRFALFRLFAGQKLVYVARSVK